MRWLWVGIMTGANGGHLRGLGLAGNWSLEHFSEEARLPRQPETRVIENGLADRWGKGLPCWSGVGLKRCFAPQAVCF